MVLSFFKGGSSESDFEHIVSRSITMLGDARHSFDLATMALLTDADASAVEKDVRDTDHRINLAEQELRSELVVHVSVRGVADIGSVLGFMIVLKKIERIGDQAKNILELAVEGISLADRPNAEQMLAERTELSALFGEAATLLADSAGDEAAIAEFTDRAGAILDTCQEVIQGSMSSEEPAHEVVPVAFYYRYLRRILANLIGVVRSSIDPLPQVDYLEGGQVDVDD